MEKEEAKNGGFKISRFFNIIFIWPWISQEVAKVVDQTLNGSKVDVLISEWMGCMVREVTGDGDFFWKSWNTLNR